MTNELTDEQKEVWRRISEPYIPPMTNVNIAIGRQAGKSTMAAAMNTAIGYQSMAKAFGIPQNIMIGYKAK